MKINIETANVELCRLALVEIDARLAQLAGEPLVLESCGYEYGDPPVGGATLSVDWAVTNKSYVEWYPTAEAARAALLALAREYGCRPREDGWYVDLTALNCDHSSAHVTRLPAWQAVYRDSGGGAHAGSKPLSKEAAEAYATERGGAAAGWSVEERTWDVPAYCREGGAS